MNYKLVTLMALAIALCLAVAPASAVSTLPTLEDLTGQIDIRVQTSTLNTNGPIEVFISNDADKSHREYKMTMLPDGTWSERFIPGDFTLRYGTCKYPVRIALHETTVAAIAPCVP